MRFFEKKTLTILREEGTVKDWTSMAEKVDYLTREVGLPRNHYDCRLVKEGMNLLKEREREVSERKSMGEQCTLGQYVDILKKRWFLKNRGQ